MDQYYIIGPQLDPATETRNLTYKYGRFVYSGSVVTEPLLGLEYLPGVLQGIQAVQVRNRAARGSLRAARTLCVRPLGSDLPPLAAFLFPRRARSLTSARCASCPPRARTCSRWRMWSAR